MSCAIKFDDLPPRDIFPSQMPRYPNIWFLVEKGTLSRPKYSIALRRLVGVLEDRIGLQDTFLEDVKNPNLRVLLGASGEGSDFQARVGPFHHYTDTSEPSLSHWHQVHARFYVSSLLSTGRTMWEDYYLIPASAHYEVATEDPLHPYADLCPHCGIIDGTEIDRSTEDYCIKIHDPLGLEILSYGTVRGKEVHGKDGKRITALVDLDCELVELNASGEPGRYLVVILGEGWGT